MVAMLGAQMEPLPNRYDSDSLYEEEPLDTLDETNANIIIEDPPSDIAQIDRTVYPGAGPKKIVQLNKKRTAVVTLNDVNSMVTAKKQKLDAKAEVELEVLQLKKSWLQEQIKVTRVELEIKNVQLEKEKSSLQQNEY